MAKKILLPNDWRPRDCQMDAWGYLENGGKRAVEVWHRRAGKDSVCLNWAAVAAHQRVANYWHMLPEAAQARKAIWDAVNPHTGVRLIDQAFPRELRATTREQDMLIRFKNGSTWQVLGSDNYNSLVGSPPAGVVFSEWSLCDPAAWDYLRPILAENGGWAFFIYTPRGKNHGYRMLRLAQETPGWHWQILTAEETGIIPPEVLDQERAELIRLYGPDDGLQRFNQEYLCSFDAGVTGAYYATILRELEAAKRLRPFSWAPDTPVHTAWDLGMGDSTAIWFIQEVGPEIRLIDYYENTGQSLAHYLKVLRDKPYVYGTHYAPHDIEVRELGTGRSRKEVAWELGIDFQVVRKATLEDGIDAVRLMLPQCWINTDACERGLECLWNYHKEWDDKRRDFAARPYHDWSSHAADALRYYALGREQHVDTRRLVMPRLSIA